MMGEVGVRLEIALSQVNFRLTIGKLPGEYSSEKQNFDPSLWPTPEVARFQLCLLSIIGDPSLKPQSQ